MFRYLNTMHTVPANVTVTLLDTVSSSAGRVMETLGPKQTDCHSNKQVQRLKSSSNMTTTYYISKTFTKRSVGLKGA